MKLSLSVRIAEGFLSKEIPILGLEDVLKIATQAGFEAVCMRASQVGIQSSNEIVERAVRLWKEHKLAVSMLTGDFDTVYNNQRGPESLRNMAPYLDLAQSLGASMIRVAVKNDEDIRWARKAADQAAGHGIRLVHQCHTLSKFETVDSIETTLRAIDRENFGLIYEPANLELCGQDYRIETIQRLAPWIFNVYLQNQRLKADGKVTLDTWCRGPVPFDIVPIHSPGGIDFANVIEGLEQIGYDGYVTVHQSATDGETPSESATRTASFLRQFVS